MAALQSGKPLGAILIPAPAGGWPAAGGGRDIPGWPVGRLGARRVTPCAGDLSLRVVCCKAHLRDMGPFAGGCCTHPPTQVAHVTPNSKSKPRIGRHGTHGTHRNHLPKNWHWHSSSTTGRAQHATHRAVGLSALPMKRPPGGTPSGRSPISARVEHGKSEPEAGRGGSGAQPHSRTLGALVQTIGRLRQEAQPHGGGSSYLFLR